MKRGGPLKRRTPLRSTAKLQTRTRLRATTPLAKVNRKRKAKVYARNYGERGELVRAMPCVLRGRHPASRGLACSGRVVAAHVRARGMGGAKGSRRDLAPLCDAHHRELDDRLGSPERFSERYGVDLLAIAERIALDLDGRGIP